MSETTLWERDFSDAPFGGRLIVDTNGDMLRVRIEKDDEELNVVLDLVDACGLNEVLDEWTYQRHDELMTEQLHHEVPGS